MVTDTIGPKTDNQIREEEPSSPYYLMPIRPCPAPVYSDETIAHIYSEEATNTFVVRRLGACIYAEVHGGNQIENTSDVPTLDTVRNKMVAIGSKFGLGEAIIEIATSPIAFR